MGFGGQSSRPDRLTLHSFLRKPLFDTGLYGFF